jgi:hypothetical protein
VWEAQVIGHTTYAAGCFRCDLNGVPLRFLCLRRPKRPAWPAATMALRSVDFHHGPRFPVDAGQYSFPATWIMFRKGSDDWHE